MYDILDLEDLLKNGTHKETCPYYSSREAAKSAQVIILPYSSLLCENTREALGIDLTENIVICDEAHNLIDAIASAHNCQVTLTQLSNSKHASLMR